MGEFLAQGPRDEEIYIVEYVTDRVPCVTRQAAHVGLMPTARVHVGRQTAIEMEAAVSQFGHRQHGRRHAVISLDNRQWVMFVDADQQHGVWHTALAEVDCDRPKLFQKPALLPTSQLRFDAANHFREVETASRKAPPLVTWK